MFIIQKNIFICKIVFSFETRSLSLYGILSVDQEEACLCLPNAGSKGVHYCTQARELFRDHRIRIQRSNQFWKVLKLLPFLVLFWASRFVRKQVNGTDLKHWDFSWEPLFGPETPLYYTEVHFFCTHIIYLWTGQLIVSYTYKQVIWV